MARRDTAARRYAEAAFELAREGGGIEAWQRDLEAILVALRDADLRRLVEHPGIPYADKEKVVRRVVSGVGDQPLALLLLMVRRGRPGAIEGMVARFEELVRRDRGIELAEVRTALALEDKQRDEVIARLRELTGNEIEINEVVDESLIGGLTVRIGDRLYDASVRNRLERLRMRLTAI